MLTWTPGCLGLQVAQKHPEHGRQAEAFGVSFMGMWFWGEVKPTSSLGWMASKELTAPH